MSTKSRVRLFLDLTDYVDERYCSEMLNRCADLLRDNGYSFEEIDRFLKEATSQDINWLYLTVSKQFTLKIGVD